jgi:hypothetical protein
MAGAPFNFFSQTNKPGCYPTGSSLFCLRNGILMEINTARQIKTSVYRSDNPGLENNLRVAVPL